MTTSILVKSTHPLARIGAHTLAKILLAIAVLLAFGGTLLPLLGHGLILCLEVLELLVEHLIESVFAVSPRTAQIITAWTGLFALLFILLKVGKWLGNGIQRLQTEILFVKARHGGRVQK